MAGTEEVEAAAKRTELPEEKDVNESGEKKEESISPECLIKHPLHHTWTLWFLETDRSKTWEEMLKEVTSFSTVEDFWALFNYIKTPSEIKTGCDYYLFKKDIRPMWEDSTNKRGGKWLLNIQKSQKQELDGYWLDTILCLIGEAFENSDEICGAAVNVRPKVDKIAIWTANGQNRAACMEIGQKFKERLNLNPKVTLQYHMHHDSMVKAGSAAKSSYSV